MKGAAQFNKLVDQLIHKPEYMWGGFDVQFTPNYLDDTILNSYCHGAIEMIQRGEVDPLILEKILDEYQVLCGNNLDTKDYVTDIIRVTARECDLDEIYLRATNEYLRVLQMEMEILNQREEMKKAERAYRRGKKYWEEVNGEVDQVVKASIFKTFAETWLLYSRNHQGKDAIMRVLVAIDFLVKSAEITVFNDSFQDYYDTCNILSQVCRQLMNRVHLYRHELGAAAVLPWIKSAVKGFKTAREFELFAEASLRISTALSETRASYDAEIAIQDALVFSKGHIRDDLLLKLNIQLAQAISEQKRYEESKELQLKLLEQTKIDTSLFEESAVLCLGIGNCYYKSKEFKLALDYYNQALEHLSHDKNERLKAQLYTVSAEVQFKINEKERALILLEKAKTYFTRQGSGIHLLQFQWRAANLLFQMKNWTECEKYLVAAEENLSFVLNNTREMSTWESMLQEWHDLPAKRVEISLRKGATLVQRKAALISTETAKGRLMELVRFKDLEQAEKVALSQKRRSDAIDKIVTWCFAKEGRYVLSLFGTDNGLAIWVLGVKKQFHGIWIDEMQYQQFMGKIFEPWEILMEESGYDEDMSEWAGTVTELLLTKIGEWLWRACPKLVDGGSEIVISPHRLFRSLPLHHCTLPGGNSIGNLFEKVTIVPTLIDFNQSLQKKESSKNTSWSVVALADPNDDLPLSRFDGFSTNTKNVKTGLEVTSEETFKAFSKHDIILLSCHGDFDEGYPWKSHLNLSDGELDIWKLLDYTDRNSIRAKVIILGACEAGKSRRSLSDEAIGFPGFLIHAGVECVLAPLWKVNDLSSALYVSEFIRRVLENHDPVTAI